MIYKIYEIIEPDELLTHPDSVFRGAKYVLGDPYIIGLKCEHLCFDDALNEIKTKADKLKGKYLTILPIIYVDFNNELM